MKIIHYITGLLLSFSGTFSYSNNCCLSVENSLCNNNKNTKFPINAKQFLPHTKEHISPHKEYFKLLKITTKKKDSAIKMFDKDLSKWEIWMGVVHTSVDLPGVEKFNDVTAEDAIPLGLNKNPKKVFSVNKEGVLHITGEIYGGLTTKKEYGDYHLKVQFKWGEKKWEPRLKDKRDSGILYHCKGEHGKFWNVWKQCLEFQVQEGDCGDFIALGDVFGDVPSIQKKRDNGNVYRIFDPKGELAPIKWKAFPTGQVTKSTLNERPNGEWNTLEIFVIGDKSIHIVNGTLVNAVVNARYGKPGNTVVVTKGQIQIQSEAAEVFYKNMTITENLKDFPDDYKKQLGW